MQDNHHGVQPLPQDVLNKTREFKPSRPVKARRGYSPTRQETPDRQESYDPDHLEKTPSYEDMESDDASVPRSPSLENLGDVGSDYSP
jgi:hypothetical protein